MIRSAVIAVACLAGVGCGKPVEPCGPATATVSRVVDGDTVELDNGDRVRYLLVDAPETTSGKNDCFGTQAVEYNRTQVEGKVVSLTYDEGACKDWYGRWLAYVSVGATDVNRGLMENGLACVLYIPPGGMSRKTEFEDLETVAKTNRVGLWGACNPVTCE